MSIAKNFPTNRAVLFANLGQALNNGEKFPDLFESSSEISPVCYRETLSSLYASIREQPDVPLLRHLTNSGLFLPWEIRLIRFGLATLKIAEVFARLCDYYVLVGTVTGRMIKWSVGLWILLSVSLGYQVFSGGSSLFSLGPVQLGGIAACASLLSGCLLAAPMLKGWIEPDSVLWMTGAKIPLFRSLMVARSVYQFLLNLGLCIQGGFDLDRSLKLSAKSEPVGWLRHRYQGVAEEVAGGAQISKAFVSSGILTETKILAVGSDAARGALWEPGITEIVRQSFATQLLHTAQLIIFLLLAALLLTWLSLLFTL